MAGCGARSTTSECMGDVDQGTTLLRPCNGYMRPYFTPFISGAYVLAPPHPSIHPTCPLEPLSPRALEALQWLAVAGGLPWRYG